MATEAKGEEAQPRLPLRVVFMGTPLFAVAPLEVLLRHGAEVAAVVCQPDKPSGRGRQVKPPPVKEVAQRHGIPVLQPERIRGTDFHERLAELRPDVVVVAAYGKILPPEVLHVPRHGCINIHASLLPKYRGAAPIQWALINGEHETGVTIMQMDEGMDTGPILYQEVCKILEDDDAESLSNMLSCLGARLLVRTLERLVRVGRLEGVPQDHTKATRAPMLRKSDGLLDWTQPTEVLINHVRGLKPWPGALTYADGTLLKILRMEPLPASYPNAKPGEIVELDRRLGFVVKTGDGCAVVTKLQPANRPPMSGVEAINGRYVRQGMILLPNPGTAL